MGSINSIFVLSQNSFVFLFSFLFIHRLSHLLLFTYWVEMNIVNNFGVLEKKLDWLMLVELVAAVYIWRNVASRDPEETNRSSCFRIASFTDPLRKTHCGCDIEWSKTFSDYQVLIPFSFTIKWNISPVFTKVKSSILKTNSFDFLFIQHLLKHVNTFRPLLPWNLNRKL